jgi:uridine kinase
MAVSRLVGIGGPSCSGKTELARWLSRATGAPMLNLDQYYLDLAHLDLEERAKTNFDEPASVDHDAILDHARRLRSGGSIHAPLYDFSTHARRQGDEVVGPGPVILLEGIFALYWPELREMLDVKLFVDAPDEVCLARRLERDIRERGRTRESVLHQFATTVQPMAHLHVLPTRAHADLVLSGTDAIASSGARALALIG